MFLRSAHLAGTLTAVNHFVVRASWFLALVIAASWASVCLLLQSAHFFWSCFSLFRHFTCKLFAYKLLDWRCVAGAKSISCQINFQPNSALSPLWCLDATCTYSWCFCVIRHVVQTVSEKCLQNWIAKAWDEICENIVCKKTFRVVAVLLFVLYFCTIKKSHCIQTTKM